MKKKLISITTAAIVFTMLIGTAIPASAVSGAPPDATKKAAGTAMTESAAPETAGAGIETPVKKGEAGLRKGVPVTYDLFRNKARTYYILFIGNSLSRNVSTYVRSITSDLGYKTVVGNAYINDRGMRTFYIKTEKNARSFHYMEDVNNGMNLLKTSGHSLWKMSEVLGRRKWDLVIINGQSAGTGQPFRCFENGDVNGVNYLEYIGDYVKAKRPGAKYAYMMTWAYENGTDESGFTFYDNDQGTMYRAICDATRLIINGGMKRVGDMVYDFPGTRNVDFIIPMGTVIQNARTTFYGGTLTADGKHMADGIGKYLGSLTIAKCLGLPVNNLRRVNAYGTAAVSPIHLNIMRPCIDAALTAPFSVTKQDPAPPRLKAPDISLTAYGERSIKVCWDDVPGASQYQIRYKADRDDKYNTVTINGGQLAYVFKIKGKQGRKYTIRVRSLYDDMGPSKYTKKEIKR